jgi:hypothetical protein
VSRPTPVHRLPHSEASPVKTPSVPVQIIPVFRRVGKIAKKTTISFFVFRSPRITVCSYRKTRPNWRIFTKFHMWAFFENLSRKFKFDQNLARITSTVYEHLCTFTVISRWIYLRIRNISDESRRWNRNKHFMFNKFFFFLRNCAVYEMRENMVETDRSQITIKYCKEKVRFACKKKKKKIQNTGTHS